MQKINNKIGLIATMKQQGIAVPSSEETAIVILDACKREIQTIKFDNEEDCYDMFNDLCRFYEEASYDNKSITVDFPKGCFGVDEDDEACEDYGTIMFVFENNTLSLIVEQQNYGYYGD